MCRTFLVKRAVWAGALSCWNILAHTSPRPPPPPFPLRRCLGMKGMTTCLETLSLYQAALTFPLSKNTHTNVFLYNWKLQSDKTPPTDFFQVATYPSVCSNLPRCEESWNILNFKIIKWQFCSNVCLVRISVNKKTKVNLGLRPRTGNAKNYCVVSKIKIFGPTNPHLVEDVITKKSSI